MNVLVLNAGSSSLKFDLWGMSGTESLLAQGNIERVSSMDDAFQSVFTKLGDAKIDAVGHRVVHGGVVFHSAVPIDDGVEKKIEELSALAPLHNPHNLEGIRVARAHLPRVPHVAVFDTAFHCTLPPHAYVYALPYEYLTDKNIRRYGFHGISHRYVSWQFGQLQGKTAADYRLITCHLGNGCSVCAIDQGKSMDTSMGFTPLEGLVMGSRSGDVDAGAILYLIDNEKQDPQAVLRMLNSDSGIKGISGVSNDMRDVMKKAAEGDPRSALAIETFCYRVRKYIGAYLAAMNGADAIIFTGGIGENSAEIRSRICNALTKLGITIDDTANNTASKEARQVGNSAIPVWVIPTQEELLIARDTVQCVA